MSPFWTAPPPRETVGGAVYRHLREALLWGHVPMGTRINELELARAWQVSRTPVRDALRRLEAEGLVQAAPGRGVIVPILGLADLDELYELREVLESRTARRAAQRATPEFHARLHGLIRAFGAAMKREDHDAMLALDEEIHAAVAEMAGSARLEQTLRLVRGQTHAVRLRSFRVRGRAAKSLKEMARVVAAMRARDGRRAEDAMREHLASLRADLPALFQAAAVEGLL